MGRAYPRVWSDLARRVAGGGVVAVAVAGAAAGREAAGQCNYEITAVIAAPRCPAPFNNVPATIGTALTEGPDPAVVGFYFPCGAGTADTAFVWRATTGLVTLPRPAGVGSMGAYDISKSGVIVGTYTVSGVGFRGFVYENGQYTELSPLPGGAWSEAWAIAKDGTVVGYRSIGPDGTVTPFNAFIWSEADGFFDLGVMNGPNSAARSISNTGQVVGWTGAGNTNQGFLFDDGGLVVLGPIPVRGGLGSRAAAVNNVGVIAGSGAVQEEPGAPLRALGFVWREGEFTLIEPVVGHDTSGVGDINRVGQVTGLSVVQGSTLGPGYVWQDGLTHDLNDLVLPGSALVIRGGTAINDAGQIIANGLALNGDTVTFLLTPIDRPLGDINIDCEVGVADLVILINDFSQAGSPADLNGEGVVNVLDLIILLLNFGA